MFDGFSKREILALTAGVVALIVLGSFGGVYRAKYLSGDGYKGPRQGV